MKTTFTILDELPNGVKQYVNLLDPSGQAEEV